MIDMPPGTGDIALTLSQLLPLSGAVVVCTPQDVALLDAVKAIAMFRKVNIPLLGLVENMSYFLCPGCGQSYDIFGRAERGDAPSNCRCRFWGRSRSRSGFVSAATKGGRRRTSTTPHHSTIWRKSAGIWSATSAHSTAPHRLRCRRCESRELRVESLEPEVGSRESGVGRAARVEEPWLGVRK